MDSFQITIDGPAATGKSTVAKELAKHFLGFYINTGEMFRTLTWLALEDGIDPKQNPEKVIELLPTLNMQHETDEDGNLLLCHNGIPVDSEKVRTPQIASFVSYVAKIAEVREWMNERQRDSANLGIIAMEGRDIGTVIFPHARFKFYLTASPEVRAARRFAQSGEVSADATIASVAAEIAKRDHLDTTRKVAPLKPAQDALIINTDELDAEAVILKIINTIEKQL